MKYNNKILINKVQNKARCKDLWSLRELSRMLFILLNNKKLKKNKLKRNLKRRENKRNIKRKLGINKGIFMIYWNKFD